MPDIMQLTPGDVFGFVSFVGIIIFVLYTDYLTHKDLKALRQLDKEQSAPKKNMLLFRVIEVFGDQEISRTIVSSKPEAERYIVNTIAYRKSIGWVIGKFIIQTETIEERSKQ